jgi:hypothetical protein
MVDYLYGWVEQINDTIPPFCVEVYLKDGNRYFLHSVGAKESENNSVVLRIWDLRALTDRDIDEMKSSLNKIKTREELHDEQKIHPKLDWANLRIHLNDIAYCVEWHDRLWPEEKRPMGFV